MCQFFYNIKINNNKLWIIIGFWLAIILESNCMPVTGGNRTARSQITIGPCTWVLERSCPDDDIRIYLYTRENPKDRQLIYIDDTWETSNLSNSNFNPLDPIKVIMHGYNSDMFLTPLIQMRDEYLQRGNYNLFYIDWSALSPGPCYPSAVHNTRHVGKCLAQLVERILDSGTGNIHLIGFSLGAHLGNFIANALPTFRIPRITGLDPALPLFITADIDNKLDETDAEFVDVIHTNAFVQGKIERCGHVDFYMNGGILQPGCWQAAENPFACSHHRAPDYFSESIRSYRGFWGWACSSYINYLLGLCPPTNYLVLAGEDCQTTTNGMYLVTTNSVTPFANGRFTDLSQLSKTTSTSALLSYHKQFTKADPLQREIDQWGKLDGTFNNIDIFPTPYSQDPNGMDWPYFNELETSQLNVVDNLRNENIPETSTKGNHPQQQQQPQKQQQQPQQQQHQHSTTSTTTTTMKNYISQELQTSSTGSPVPLIIRTNNTIFLNNLKNLYNKRIKENTNSNNNNNNNNNKNNNNLSNKFSMENYKRNITKGIHNSEVFTFPEIILNN